MNEEERQEHETADPRRDAAPPAVPDSEAPAKDALLVADAGLGCLIAFGVLVVVSIVWASLHADEEPVLQTLGPLCVATLALSWPFVGWVVLNGSVRAWA